MPTDDEIIQAKRVLRNAGYLCVPREKVLRIGGNVSINGRDWLTYGDDPSFVHTVRSQVARAIAERIVENANAVDWSTVTGSQPSSGFVEGRIAMLSTAESEDPIISMIRETQRVGRFD